MSTIPEKLKNKLSIAAKRLNNSDECQNCGTALQGPYCHYCGQPDKNFSRFFPALLREMMGDLLDFDSRLTRTLKPLLFQPGKLADDYMHGRRFRYSSPVRLYLFSSIIFFLLASFITGISIQNEISINGAAVTVDQESIVEAPPAKTELTDANSKSGEKLGDTDIVLAQTDQTEAITDTSPSADTDKKNEKPGLFRFDLGEGFKFDLEEGGGEDGNQIKTVNLPLVPQQLNDWINSELAKSESKGKAIAEDPTIITSMIFDMLPMTVFILLPVFALLLKFFYMFSNRYYTEHLIFALYNHSFVFVLATVLLLFESSFTYFVSQEWLAESNWMNSASKGLINVFLIWTPVYFWLALKRFYQQSWLMTSLKFFTIGVCYLVLLTSVTVFVALLSFLLLRA